MVINVATESNFDERTQIDDASRGVTYVPHVGMVTVAALEYNLISLHRKFNSNLRRGGLLLSAHVLEVM